jgi:hypothetical protein
MLNFDDFKALATDTGLADYERVGFTAAHRAARECAVFPDIRDKLSLDALRPTDRIVDIGAGCSRPVRDLVAWAGDRQITVELVDSAEMLANLPDAPYVVKIPGRYPDNSEALQPPYQRIIVYSVLPMIVFHQNHIEFCDRAAALLAPGGMLFIGDIPNASKKRRFVSTQFGKSVSRQFASGDPQPPPMAVAEIDDALVFSLMSRYRLRGYETYLLPQSPDLPLNYTREDMLIVRPLD